MHVDDFAILSAISTFSAVDCAILCRVNGSLSVSRDPTCDIYRCYLIDDDGREIASCLELVLSQ